MAVVPYGPFAPWGKVQRQVTAQSSKTQGPWQRPWLLMSQSGPSLPAHISAFLPEETRPALQVIFQALGPKRKLF